MILFFEMEDLFIIQRGLRISSGIFSIKLSNPRLAGNPVGFTHKPWNMSANHGHHDVVACCGVQYEER